MKKLRYKKLNLLIVRDEYLLYLPPNLEEKRRSTSGKLDTSFDLKGATQEDSINLNLE